MQAILWDLRQLLALVFRFGPRAGIRPALCNYLVYTGRRFARVMERLEAGTLVPPRPRGKRARTEPEGAGREGVEPAPPVAPPVPLPRVRLPGGRMWVIREVGWRAVAFRSQLQYLLRRPEIAALVAATPQAQRVLRPLCHMLGMDVACVPPLPRRRRAPRRMPAAKRGRLTRREREAILWYPNSEGTPMTLLPRRLPRD